MSVRKKRSNAHARRKKNPPKPKTPRWRRAIAGLRQWPGWPLIFVLVVAFLAAPAAMVLFDSSFKAYFGVFLLDYDFSWRWVAIYAASSAIFIYGAGCIGWPDLSTTSPITGRFARGRRMFLCITVVLMLNAMNVFALIPWLLHQITATPGHSLVTVSQKEAYGGYRGCSRRIQIEEFGGAFLCPTEQFYRVIRRGELLLLEGKVSPFGMSVEYYLWVAPDPETGRLVRQHKPIPTWH